MNLTQHCFKFGLHKETILNTLTRFQKEKKNYYYLPVIVASSNCLYRFICMGCMPAVMQKQNSPNHQFSVQSHTSECRSIHLVANLCPDPVTGSL